VSGTRDRERDTQKRVLPGTERSDTEQSVRRETESSAIHTERV